MNSKPPLTSAELERILTFESDPLIQRLGIELKATRDALANLEARIFRDGGHKAAALGGPLAAAPEADAAVVQMLRGMNG